MTPNLIRRNGNISVPARPLSGWVDRLLNENLNLILNDDFWGFKSVDQNVNVPVNLRETDKTYEMELVAPGLRKEDFKLNVSHNQLTVSFEQKNENMQESKDDGWLRKEYIMKSFSRNFTLDDTIEQSKIQAVYENGILHLTLPKKANAQQITKTIEVK